MAETRARACAGKQRHPNRETAEAHRFSLIRNGASPGRVASYKCPYCSFWHVGHRMRGRR